MSKKGGVNIHLPTPECDKLSKVADVSQSIGEFIDWLNERGIQLAHYPMLTDDDEDEYQSDQLFPIAQTVEALLAEYFEIDLNRVEHERRAILTTLQARHTVEV